VEIIKEKYTKFVSVHVIPHTVHGMDIMPSVFSVICINY
jgi:hypothetical protein